MSAMSNNFDDQFQRGFELRCEGRYGEAKLILETLLKRDPTHMGAKHQLALILGFEGDFEGSVAALEVLCAQSPRNLNVLYDLAMSQMMIGLNDEACGNFRRILTLDPQNEKASQQVVYCP